MYVTTYPDVCQIQASAGLLSQVGWIWALELQTNTSVHMYACMYVCMYNYGRKYDESSVDFATNSVIS
jgi:hypothetical protein